MCRLLLIACVLFAPVVHATVLVPAEFREVVQGSELIAYGRVVDTRPQWADGRTRIDTVVTVEVASWLKGGSDDTITFKVPGGEMGRYRSVLIGAPVFKPGDEAVLFLKSDGSEFPIVFGLNQGVFRVRIDPDTGRRMVVPPPLMATSSAPEVVTRGAATRRPLALDEFGAQVRAAMAPLPGAPGRAAAAERRGAGR
jgi:hypothetical protein